MAGPRRATWLQPSWTSPMRKYAGAYCARAPSLYGHFAVLCARMTNAAVRTHRKAHPLLWLLVAGGYGCRCLSGVHILLESFANLEWKRSTPPTPSWFRAAEYSGHPSPVWRARPGSRFRSLSARLAPVVITTGGSGGDPSYNEGQVGHDYLMHRGVPEPA